MLAQHVPPFRARWAALLALGGGLTGVLAFPRFGIWPAAFLSVALLSSAVHGRRSRSGAWLGYLYGGSFLLPLLSWTGIYVGAVPWIILSLAFAAFFAVLGAVLPVVQRLPGAALWIGAAWVLEEFLRDRVPFGGFPWGRLAFSQAAAPTRWFAALGGAPLLSFVVAAAGGGLFGAVWNAQALQWRAVAPGVAVLLGVPALGVLLSWPLAPAPDAAGSTMTVAVIQGGLPDLGLRFENRARQVLDDHVAQTMRLAREIRAGTLPQPGLVVWPEDSSDVDPLADPTAYQEIDAAVRAVGAPVLVGAILQGPGPIHRRNVGILWSPTTGPGAEYVKRHPVPFGEYIPLRGLAEAVSSYAKLVTQDMVGGHGNGLLRGASVPIGDVICFEVAYDGLVRSSVAAGAQLLVVQTNNATFGHTAETYQQLAMSQVRAVESGRTVLQAATTGLSAVIGPDGRVRDQSGALFTPAILLDTVPVRTATTLATRLGPMPEYVLVAVAVLGLAGAVWRGRRHRECADPEPEPRGPTHEEMVRT